MSENPEFECPDVTCCSGNSYNAGSNNQTTNVYVGGGCCDCTGCCECFLSLGSFWRSLPTILCEDSDVKEVIEKAPLCCVYAPIETCVAPFKTTCCLVTCCALCPCGMCYSEGSNKVRPGFSGVGPLPPASQAMK